MVPDPDQRGIDVSAGYSTLVAIAGKEVIRKPWPYGTCTSSDHELKLLRESLRKLLRPNKPFMFCVTLQNHGKPLFKKYFKTSQKNVLSKFLLDCL